MTVTEAEHLLKEIRDLCYVRLRDDIDPLAGTIAHMTQDYLLMHGLAKHSEEPT